jgi:hypothetical protein
MVKWETSAPSSGRVLKSKLDRAKAELPEAVRHETPEVN